MKINFTQFLLYYHRVSWKFIYFNAQATNYLKTENLFAAIFLASYLITSILFIIFVFNLLDVVLLQTDCQNYLEELDFPMELIEKNENKGNANPLRKFLNLFNKSDVYYVLPAELKNSFYTWSTTCAENITIENTSSLNEGKLLFTEQATDKYFFRSAFYWQKISSDIEILRGILLDLREINNNILSIPINSS